MVPSDEESSESSSKQRVTYEEDLYCDGESCVVCSNARFRRSRSLYRMSPSSVSCACQGQCAQFHWKSLYTLTSLNREPFGAPTVNVRVPLNSHPPHVGGLAA